MTELNINEALELAKDTIVTDKSGNKWIKIEDLKKLETKQIVEKVTDEKEPKPTTFGQAKSAAFKDSELQKAFAGRPPVVGPSPPAA